jgi:hypothetical protein
MKLSEILTVLRFFLGRRHYLLPPREPPKRCRALDMYRLRRGSSTFL